MNKLVCPNSAVWVIAAGFLLIPHLSNAQQTSTICSFDDGPRAGKTHDYAPRAALPVGSACNDGAGSTGTIIAKPESSRAATTRNDSGDNSDDSSETSTICSFDDGPRAGKTHDYAPRAALPVGSACNDGAGSTGTIIAKKAPAR